MLRTRFPLLLFTAVFATAPGHAQTQPTFFQPYSLGNSGNSLATADFNGDGNLDVAIAGSDLTVALGNGYGSFHSLAPLAYNAAQIVAGDFNGDGRPDLVLSVGNQVVFLPGKGDGTFGSQEIIGVFPATAIAAADLNHDGKLDLLVNSKTVLVLLGNGDGTFQKPSSTGGTTSGRIVIADFNRDGNPDFAITAGIPPVLQVFPGKGDGTFGAPQTTSLTGGTGGSFAAGDFTGDGIPDVAVPTLTGTQVYIGRGDGTFTGGPATAFSGNYLVAGDLNGDGKLDLVSGSPMAVLAGKGDGSFKVPAYTYQGGGAAILGRFRKNGPLDIVAGGLYYRNMGNGKLDDPPSFATPYAGLSSNVASLRAGDFTGDGKIDLVMVNGSSTPNPTVAVYPGNGRGGFGAYIETSLGSSLANTFASEIVTGDFNNDGKLDIALSVYYSSSQQMVVLLGNGDGSFRPPIVTAGFQPLLAGDFNNDGKLDLAVSMSGGIGILLGNGDGTFSLKTTLPVAPFGFGQIAVDLNRDGNLDLVVPPNIFLGNGDGTFRQAPPIVNAYANWTVSADFNGDGIPDLAMSVGGFDVWILLGNGDGTFRAPLELSGVDNQDFPLLIGDFNRDGIPDLAAGTKILLGKGDGTFSPATTNILVSPDAWDLVVTADFNGDGKPDFALVFGNQVMTVMNTTP